MAEDLTAEVFLAAVRSVRAGKVERVTVAWLIGIARHKLVDHWRAQEREEARGHARKLVDKYAALLGRGASRFVEDSSSQIRQP